MTDSTSWQALSLPTAAVPGRFSGIRYSAFHWTKRPTFNELAVLKYAVHALVWAFLYLLPELLFLSPLSNWNRGSFTVFDTANNISFFFLVVYFYINYYILVPRWYLAGLFTRYFLIAAVTLVLLVTVQYIGGNESGFFVFATYSVVLFVISTLLSVVLCQQSGMLQSAAQVPLQALAKQSPELCAIYLMPRAVWHILD